MKPTTSLSRRTMLRGVAAGATVRVGLPVLEVMLPRRARAMTSPRAFVMFAKPTGMSAYRGTPSGVDEWTPRQTGSGYLVPKLLQPFADLKADVTVISGVHNRMNVGPVAHGAQATLFAPFDYVPVPGRDGQATLAGGWSIDHAIAERIGQGTTFRTLELGAYLYNIKIEYPTMEFISFRGKEMPAMAEVDPGKVWTRLFTGAVTEGSPDLIERLRKQRITILDGVRANLDLIKRRVSASDRNRLDQHLTALREIETRVVALSAAASCRTPAQARSLPQTTQNRDLIVRTQLDLLAAALVCDLTRSASFILCGAANNIVYPDLGVDVGHHALSHGGERAKTDIIDLWQIAQAAYFVRQLKSTPEVGGTLLDRTTVLIGSECASGASHNEGGWVWGGERVEKGNLLDFAFLLAGGTHYFRHGAHVRYRAGAITHEQILRSCYESATGVAGPAAAEWMSPKYRAEPAPGLRGDSSSVML